MQCEKSPKRFDIVSIEILLRDPDDRPLQADGQLFFYQQGEFQAVETKSNREGRLIFGDPPVPDWLIVSYRRGYWTLRFDPENLPEEIRCPRLPRPGERMWWHRILGIESPSPTAGQGIRIGVVDTGFAQTAGLEHASLYDDLGEEIQARSRPLPWHGEQISRLIGQRMADPTRFGGIAPGADLICIDAGDSTAVLNSARAASAILRLAVDFRCDLINLSAGSFDELADLADLQSAVQRCSLHRGSRK